MAQTKHVLRTERYLRKSFILSLCDKLWNMGWWVLFSNFTWQTIEIPPRELKSGMVRGDLWDSLEVTEETCYFGRVVFMSHITQKNVKIKIVHWLSKYKAGSKSKITVAMLDLPECEGKFTISFTSNCIYKFAFKRSLHQPAYLW